MMANLKNLLLIILGTTFVSVCSSSPPRILLEDGTDAPDEITIPAGGNLSLTCRDVQPVQWRLHLDLHISNAIDCEDQEDEELPYCVSIMITNINYTDVGFFPCVHNTSSNWVDTYQYHPDFQDAKAVYVYVKDEEHLLVPTNLVINGERNKPLVVPCKPTFPAVRVTITKMHSSEAWDFILMGFKPKKGFTVMYIGAEDTMFTCKASYSVDFTDSVDGILNIVDNTDSASDEIPGKPDIKVSTSVNIWQNFGNEYDIIEGSSFNITCTNEEANIPLFFIHPPTANLTGKHEVYRYHGAGNRPIRNYILPDADPEKDSGIYGCFAKQWSKVSQNATIEVNVLPKGSHHLSLQMEESDPEYEARKRSYHFLFRAYPQPIFTWKKKEMLNGTLTEEVIHTGFEEFQTPKYEFNIFQKTGEVTLILKDVNLDTIAEYILQAELPNTTLVASNNFTVEFDNDPEDVSIEGEGFEYVLKQHVTFLIKCFARGHPAPKLSLEFQSCMPKCGEFIDVSTGSDNNESVHYTSPDGPLVKDRETHWKGNALSQGNYRCSATDGRMNIPTYSHEKPFRITDGAKSSDLYMEVSIEDKESKLRGDLQITEGDKVIIQCRANRMTTQNMPELKMLSSTGIISDIDCTDNCILNDKTTKLSFVREVTFPKIEVEGINNTKLVCRNPGDDHLNETASLFVTKGALSPVNPDPDSTTECELYNQTLCAQSSNTEGCSGTQICEKWPDSPEKKNHCFVVWTNNTEGKVEVTFKGCWMPDPQNCIDKTECVNTEPVHKKEHIFCCCNGNNCNRNFSWQPSKEKPTTTPPLSEEGCVFPFCNHFDLQPVSWSLEAAVEAQAAAVSKLKFDAAVDAEAAAVSKLKSDAKLRKCQTDVKTIYTNRRAQFVIGAKTKTQGRMGLVADVIQMALKPTEEFEYMQIRMNFGSYMYESKYITVDDLKIEKDEKWHQLWIDLEPTDLHGIDNWHLYIKSDHKIVDIDTGYVWHYAPYQPRLFTVFAKGKSYWIHGGNASLCNNLNITLGQYHHQLTTVTPTIPSGKQKGEMSDDFTTTTDDKDFTTTTDVKDFTTTTTDVKDFTTTTTDVKDFTTTTTDVKDTTTDETVSATPAPTILPTNTPIRTTSAPISCLVNTSTVNVFSNSKMDLWTASKEGNLAFIDYSLSQGTCPLWRNPNFAGFTAIHVASRSNHPAVVNRLLDAGVDINLPAYGGRTPLYVAAWLGSAATVNFLITRGADVNSPTDRGWTPLIAASYSGELHIVIALINAGANINQTNSKGRTALHWAAQGNKPIIIQLLLQKGIESQKKDNQRNTAGDVAREHGYLQIANIIDGISSVTESTNSAASTLIF